MNKVTVVNFENGNSYYYTLPTGLEVSEIKHALIKLGVFLSDSPIREKIIDEWRLCLRQGHIRADIQ